MQEKVVLLTGSTGGLGKVIAASLAEKGYRLALHYFNQEENANLLLTSLNSGNDHHKIFQADLTQHNSVEKMVADAAAAFGKLDIIINNAGISFSGMSWKQSIEEWNNVMAVNATSAFLVSRFSVPHLRKQKSGRIINISSIVAGKPMIGTSAYAASKSALEGFTKAQAVELAHFGITVNCIAPGYFDTGMIREIDEQTRAQLIKEIPAGRLGRPAELAECILYLCSDNSAYLTGQIIQLNGGLYL